VVDVLSKQQIAEALEQARKTAEKRRFTQSIDVEIKLRGIDATKQDTSFADVYTLPKGLGDKRRSVCIIADGASLLKARESGADRVLTRAELEALTGDKKSIKKLARNYDFFVADATLMANVGRIMGQVLGPRNKIPVPFPGAAEPKPIVERLRNSVRVRLKGQPVIRCMVGSEGMEAESVAENVVGLLDFVAQKVKGGASSIDSLTLKLTMSKPVRVRAK
jgi:large subunit ribosomal protein L1